MKMKLGSTLRSFSLLLIASLLLAAGPGPLNQPESGSTIQSRPGTLSVVLADNRNIPVYVPPPFAAGVRAPLRVDAIQITVNYNPASCGASIAAWPANAQAAFDFAVSIWRSVLNGTRPIVVDACWRTDLAANILGNAQPTSGYRDFTGAPQANTFYPVPLANQLANSDLNGSAVEITARFNANQTWYFGLDGNVPLNQYDLVTVVLHEMGHGLGFTGGMNWDNGIAGDGTECNGTAGVGCWGANPYVYDRLTQIGSGQTLISLGNNTAVLGNALISDTLFFNGANANAANGGSPPQLQAPNVWSAGSSYVHLREATFAAGTINGLMTPSLAAQEAIHHPGAIVLGMFRDMGWTMPDLFNTYVDASNTGLEDGTQAHPFNTVIEGIGAVANGGTVWIQVAHYPGAVTSLRPMTLRAQNGTVVIGAP